MYTDSRHGYGSAMHLRVANMHPRTEDETRQADASSLSWTFLVCVTALSLVVRITYMVIFETWNFKHEWAFGHEMGRIGQWLSEGRGFTLDGSSPTAKFPPLYPLVIAGFFSTFGVYAKGAAVGLFLFQAACSAALACCLASIGNRLFRRSTGMIVGLIWAFYPTSIFYSVVRIWYSELALLLVLVVVLVALTTPYPPGVNRVGAMGVLSGLAVLVDSTMALYLPLLLGWRFIGQRVQFLKLLGSVVIWGITAGTVVSPWMVRNWFVLGSPILVKSNFGMELLFGTETANRRKVFQSLDREALEFYRKQSEVAYNGYLRDQALERIRRQPIKFLSATARRFVQFWVINPRVGPESVVRLTYFGPFLLLALYGVWVSGKSAWQIAPLWLFLLVYPLPYYVIHVDRGRYSYPVEPYVVLFAGIPLAYLLRRAEHGASLTLIRRLTLHKDRSKAIKTLLRACGKCVL
jgi:4-amino-4-deoxy-L-arabinose transferase-like glycosyltransferase